MKNKLQIKDVIALTGLDRETLRFYEQKGLLPAPTRTESGYRQFNPDIVPRIKFIRLAQEVGFSLSEITGLLNLGKGRRFSKKDLQTIADKQIVALDARIQSLQQMRGLLVGMSERAMKVSSKDQCDIMAQFEGLEY